MHDDDMCYKRIFAIKTPRGASTCISFLPAFPCHRRMHIATKERAFLRRPQCFSVEQYRRRAAGVEKGKKGVVSHTERLVRHTSSGPTHMERALPVFEERIHLGSLGRAAR